MKSIFERVYSTELEFNRKVLSSYMSGIKAGSVASSESSVYLDGLIREIFDECDVEYIKGVKGNDLRECSSNPMHSRIQGTFPDGGILLDKDGLPLLAIECKYNGKTGNAIERWFKNYNVCKNFLKVKRYVTFLLGEGFYNDNSPSRALSTVSLYEEFNEPTIYCDNTGNFVQFYRYDSLDSLKEKVKADLFRELEIAGIGFKKHLTGEQSSNVVC